MTLHQITLQFVWKQSRFLLGLYIECVPGFHKLLTHIYPYVILQRWCIMFEYTLYWVTRSNTGRRKLIQFFHRRPIWAAQYLISTDGRSTCHAAEPVYLAQSLERNNRSPSSGDTSKCHSAATHRWSCGRLCPIQTDRPTDCSGWSVLIAPRSNPAWTAYYPCNVQLAEPPGHRAPPGADSFRFAPRPAASGTASCPSVGVEIRFLWFLFDCRRHQRRVIIWTRQREELHLIRTYH